MSNFENIRAVITSSSLDPAEKMAMIDAFADIPDEHLADPAVLLAHDPSWIMKLNENRKQKIQAFTSTDKILWKDILQQEKHYLTDLTFGLD